MAPHPPRVIRFSFNDDGIMRCRCRKFYFLINAPRLLFGFRWLLLQLCTFAQLSQQPSGAFWKHHIAIGPSTINFLSPSLHRCQACFLPSFVLFKRPSLYFSYSFYIVLPSLCLSFPFHCKRLRGPLALLTENFRSTSARFIVNAAYCKSTCNATHSILTILLICNQQSTSELRNWNQTPHR